MATGDIRPPFSRLIPYRPLSVQLCVREIGEHLRVGLWLLTPRVSVGLRESAVGFHDQIIRCEKK